MRDNRRRIVELAEQKALELDPDICQKARSDLINPRSRLAVEMAWLPGVSPAKADQLIGLMADKPMATISESGIPALAHANLIAAAFEGMDECDSDSDAAKFISAIAERVEWFNPEGIMREINEDRMVSGFPEVKALESVEAEISERRRWYRNAVMNALNGMASSLLTGALRRVVGTGLEGEKVFGLVDEIVDAYEVETQTFLDKEAENISRLVDAVRDLAGSRNGIVEPLISRIEKVLSNWDRVASPIRVSKVARGLNHRPSTAVGNEIRNLSVELFNDHGMFLRAREMLTWLVPLFRLLPEPRETLQQDFSAIDKFVRQHCR